MYADETTTEAKLDAEGIHDPMECCCEECDEYCVRPLDIIQMSDWAQPIPAEYRALEIVNGQRVCGECCDEIRRDTTR